MKNQTLLASLLAALVIAACGSDESESGSVGEATSTKASGTGEATAEQVAKEMRGKVKCPAKVSMKRAAGEPIDDVVGVRPLMSWAEAANIVMCDRPLLVVTEAQGRGYNINTFGQHIRQGFDAKFAEPRVARSSRQYLTDMAEQAARISGNATAERLQPGQVRYFVSTMGMPDQEQVISVAREEYYEVDKLPSIESVVQALVEKYGQPTQVNDYQRSATLYWVYDPSGARIPPGDQRLAHCRTSVSPDAATSLFADCGITVGAMVQASPSNPGLAQSLAVTSQQGGEGYALLMRTEAALKQADEARKASELNKANQNAGKVKL